ncbi:MAG: 3'-5' exonuclease, partial [Nitrospinales bacterium]
LEAKPTTNFRELLEGCWIALGGPACVRETTLGDVDVFFDKVSDILEAGDIRNLRHFEQSLEDLYASPALGNHQAVQIMTIHKAKGLEFDFVILPGLGKIPKSEAKRLILWMPHRDELLLAPVQEKGGSQAEVYNFLTTLDKEKEDLETLRLLYVAATRAKKQLHLFGSISNQSKKETSPKKASLLYRLWPFVKDEWRQNFNHTKIIEPTEESSNETIPRQSIYRLPVDFSYPPCSPAIDEAMDVSSASNTLTVDPEFIWAGNRARCLGTVLHRCFNDMAREGLDRWTAQRVEQIRPALKAGLLGEGLPDSELDHALDEGIQGLLNILEDETGRWIMKRHREQHSEYPVTGVLHSHCVDRVIDRTFIDKNDIRWIIDFKTGMHEGTNLEVYFEE